MISAWISRIIMLVFGTLYPAYRSYKAIKNKDVREYVKWMMYWIIFAIFITTETFADTFLSWLPLYYEIKIVFIIWLLSPATKGSSILYRKFVHPRLVKHEKAIDKYIAKAQSRSYSTLMEVGRKGFNVATDTLVKTAVTGQHQLIQTMKRYNSMQELRDVDQDTVDAAIQQRASWYNGMPASNFNPEVDVEILQRQYKPDPRHNQIVEESSDHREMHHSQSDPNISHDAGFSPPRVEVSHTIDDMSVSGQTTTSNIDYNYAYTTSTLPRVRKAKKPLHETKAAPRSRRRTDKKAT